MLLYLLGGCSSTPDLRPLYGAIEAGGQLAAGGSMTLHAVADPKCGAACVKLTAGCTGTYPCTGGAACDSHADGGSQSVTFQ